MIELQSLFLYIILFISFFFEVFLLITFFEVKDELKFEELHIGENLKNFPTVTIIIPCFNEEGTVIGTMESLLALDYPKDKFSLIVVDDGSTDNTLKVLERFRSNPQVEIYSKANGGKHDALNFALTKVNTDLVGCLDADSFVDCEALRKIVPYFDDSTIMAVTPSIKVHEPKTILQYAQKIEYSWGIFLRRMLSSIGALYVTPGPFSIFRTQVFRDLGGYRQAHHTEDMELALRMQKNRYRIVNSHGAHVYTVTPSKFKTLYKQRVRWTYGFLNNIIDYKDMFFNKKYGHIGLFIMPIATISIFSTIYAAANLLWKGLTEIWDFLTKFQAIGFTLKLPTFNFDWFFLDTGPMNILSIAILGLTLVTLFISLRVADGKAKFSKSIIYYLAIYALIVPTWLAKAVYNTLFKRSITWR